MLAIVLAAVAAVAAPAEIAQLEWARAPASELAALMAEPADRVGALRALGRLRSSDALPYIEAARSDEEAEVRLAAARALATTPGAGPALRSWLAETPPARGLGPRAREAQGVRVSLIEGLGHQGDARDVETLVAALAEQWPYAAAAAHALGRMGRRDVYGVERATGALVRLLSRPDRRTVEAAAYALRRIGLGDQPDLVAEATRAVEGAGSEVARAWLLRAVWPALELDARVDLFIVAITDPSRHLQVAALQAAGSDVPADIVAPFLASQDPWVVSEAVGALGRAGDDVAVEALSGVLAQTSDVWRQAAVAAALGGAGVQDDAPPRVRAASVAGASDEELLGLALTDADPGVRVAAAAELVERPGTGRPLSEATDPLVRELGLALIIERADPETAVAVLEDALRDEADERVIITVLEGVVALLDKAPRAAWRLRSAVQGRLAKSVGAEPRLRLAAEAAAEGLELPFDSPHLEPGRPRSVKIGGEPVEVLTGVPRDGELRGLRGARVETTDGVFDIELYPERAPLTVVNFARLADAGWFDGQAWHRVVPGFVAQTGCPRGDGWGGPGWSVPDEVSLSGFVEGAVGMARAEPDTGGSQWFVTLAPQPHLDGEYTHFGQVVRGMDVVRHLERGDRVLSVRIRRAE